MDEGRRKPRGEPGGSSDSRAQLLVQGVQVSQAGAREDEAVDAAKAFGAEGLCRLPGVQAEPCSSFDEGKEAASDVRELGATAAADGVMYAECTGNSVPSERRHSSRLA